MKNEIIRPFRNKGILALVVSLLAAAGIQANAANTELVYGVSDELGELVSFNITTPGILLTAHALTGMISGEQIRGINVIGSTLYGLGDQNHLYAINPATGSCTLVGSGFTPVLNGVDFGLGASTNQLYVSSDLGQNLSINPTNGTATVGPNYTGAVIDAMAYNYVNAQFYGLSAASHDLYLMNPVTGATTLIGPTGVNFSDRIGFAISSVSGTAYFSGSVSGQTEFFIVNLATGALTLVGDVGTPGEFSSGLNSIAVTAAVLQPTLPLLSLEQPITETTVAITATNVISGGHYAVLQMSTNLATTNWINWQTNIPASNFTVYPNVPATNPYEFYRLNEL
ncbi:MAG: DUF4394 domain-containing protein [Verrucomicrobiia bacterium]